MKPLIKNPLPGVSGIKELYINISLNLMVQLAFNPYLAPYAQDGNSMQLFQEGIICTIVSVFAIVIIIARSMTMARANQEFNVPPNKMLARLPRNKWLFALPLAIVLAPLGGLFFVFIFVFYDFTVWSFYQFLWIKIIYLTILSKIVIKLSILRFTQPDMA